MIARQGTWAEVDRDIYIRDKHGKPFRVTAATPSVIHLVDSQQATQSIERPPGHAPVTILEPTVEEAIQLLGGEIVEVRVPGEMPSCPPFDGQTIAWQRRHLQGKHYIEESTQHLDRTALAAIHRQAHTNAPSHIHSNS